MKLPVYCTPLTLAAGGYMYFSYFRIFCALSAMIGFHVASTPPHPPPSLDESVPSTSLEVLLRQRSGQLIIKTICWAATFAEIATAISKDHSELSIFKTILKLLAVPPNDKTDEQSPLLFLFGTFMAASGGYIRWRCYKALGRSFTFEMSIREDHKLVTDGPYSLVRHPGYTGILLAVSGMITWHASPGSWARECGIIHTNLGRVMVFTYFSLTTSILLGLISRMALEDAALQRVFGEQWNAWAKRVPYRLIPCIY